MTSNTPALPEPGAGAAAASRRKAAAGATPLPEPAGALGGEQQARGNFRSPARFRAMCSLGASLLLVAAAYLPFWQMTLHAPQYPAGLRLIAHGNRVIGDLREINIINHYIGMEHVDTVPAPEMSLFPVAIAGLLAVGWLALLHRRLAQLAILAMALTPLGILADLQWWLHSFGRNLNPAAPLRIEPFTPWALGRSTIGNFVSWAWPSWGFFAMLGAAALIHVGLRTRAGGARGRSARVAAAAILTLPLVAAFLPAPAGSASRPSPLQARLDAASPGDTVEITGGVHTGPITITGPLTVVGVDRPVIVGSGVGSVVTIEGEGVTFEGFTVRNSGRAVTEEAAGIKVAGGRHTIRENIVEDVYFGIHLSSGNDNLVEGNRIAPGKSHGARPGHGISLWNQSGVQVSGNVIVAARDGIYMSFADNVVASGNSVRGCRYGVHSMYSEDSTFIRNRLEGNLLGAALMYSDRLRMRCNLLSHNRQGATAYGVLLKDIDDLLLEDNLIIANRVGVYADKHSGPDRGPRRAPEQSDRGQQHSARAAEQCRADLLREPGGRQSDRCPFGRGRTLGLEHLVSERRRQLLGPLPRLRRQWRRHRRCAVPVRAGHERGDQPHAPGPRLRVRPGKHRHRARRPAVSRVPARTAADRRETVDA